MFNKFTYNNTIYNPDALRIYISAEATAEVELSGNISVILSFGSSCNSVSSVVASLSNILSLSVSCNVTSSITALISSILSISGSCNITASMIASIITRVLLSGEIISSASVEIEELNIKMSITGEAESVSYIEADIFIIRWERLDTEQTIWAKIDTDIEEWIKLFTEETIWR
ncbi:MAG: hypothetical protein PWR14_982 [Thermosediminibacterales bacterium]|nr:hypothetical protein [Thermosediminibacterales bacterium]